MNIRRMNFGLPFYKSILIDRAVIDGTFERTSNGDTQTVIVINNTKAAKMGISIMSFLPEDMKTLCKLYDEQEDKK